jgi:hypothetical protein
LGAFLFAGKKFHGFWVVSDQEVTSVVADQMAQMCQLIWIYTVCTGNKTCILIYAIKTTPGLDLSCLFIEVFLNFGVKNSANLWTETLK